MPTVVITKDSSKTTAEAFDLVKGVLDNDQDLKKLDPSYQCSFDATTKTGKAQGKLFKANLSVKEKGGGSSVEISVELPFALSLAKGLVQKTLTRKLEQYLS